MALIDEIRTRTNENDGQKIYLTEVYLTTFVVKLLYIPLLREYIHGKGS